MTKVKRQTMQRKICLFMLSCGLCLQPLVAEPAYWYRWQSTFTGKFICKQFSPGEGWQEHAGPFYDAQCRKPVPQSLGARG